MSVPQRRLVPDPAPPTAPRRVTPTRRPAARPPTSPLPEVSRRARRGSTSFWILTFVAVTILVVGVVSLSALLVQSSFRERRVRADLEALAGEHERLALQVVSLSSPTRVAGWAAAEGLVVAETVEVLRVRTARR